MNLAGRDLDQSPNAWGKWPLSNVWLGVSVELDRYAWRAKTLAETPAAVRFVSAEPLLGPLPSLDLGQPISYHVHPQWPRALATAAALQELARAAARQFAPPPIDWVIAGAESGPGARPMDDDWVRDLRDRATAAGVAFYLKQKAVNGRKISLPELDGRTWQEFPDSSARAVLSGVRS